MTRRTAAPRDRFDDVPVDLTRVGAHRAPARPHGALRVLGWAALATGLLVGAGVLGLQGIEAGVSGGTSTSSASSAPTSAAPAAPAPTVDPDASVVVLNGTGTAGLAASAAKAAEGDGWKIASTANADTQTVKASTVYYGEADQLGAARGLARSLGISKAPVRSGDFSVQGVSRLAVVLGADYAAR